ncbi:MAG: hypothetical protein IEMM0007_1682 [bacterium]|nr:MAG: hypothetical protein IEMM0007_1682 [bacterium]
MPKYAIHSIVMEECINKLQTDSNHSSTAKILDKNRSLAKLGAIGPDLFFWGQDYKVVEKFQRLYENLKDFADIYKDITEPIEEIQKRIKDKVVEPVEETIEGLFPNTVDIFKKLFDQLQEATEAYDKAKTTIIFDGVIEGLDLSGKVTGLGTTINEFFKMFEPDIYYNRPETDWYWFDMLHYRKSGEFARNLIKHADTDKKKAYAYGYLSHIATDVIGHSFVNQIVGAPYRSNVWRHVTVENYMDTWKFSKQYEGASINEKLRERLLLPKVENLFDDMPKLDSEVTDLLHSSFYETYSDVLHPVRINDGFYSRNNIEDAYEIFVRVMNLMEQAYLAPPEEPFEDVMGILAQALNDVFNSSLPPEPPSACTWDDVLSASPRCNNLSEIMEEWIDYGVQLLQWQGRVMLAILDMLMTTYLALPVSVVIALLYGFQLFCYGIYRTTRMILSLNGLVMPEPDELEWPVGQRLTTLVQACGLKYYPSTGLPSRNNLACPVNTIEKESTRASLYSGRSSNPDSFINDGGDTIDTGILKAYVDSANPEETVRLGVERKFIGNAVPLTLWMIKNAETSTVQKYVFANWNLDSDRGYGFKTWHGFLNKTLHHGEEPGVSPIKYLDDLPVNYSIGDNCFDLFSATVAPGEDPNTVNAYLLSIASQFDYPDQLYVDPHTDTNLYERRFRYLMNRWGMKVVRFINKTTGAADTEVVVMKHRNKPFIIVLFRGSESPKDPLSAVRDWLLTDFNPTPVKPTDEPKLAGVTFHGGFWNAFIAVKDEILNQLNEIRAENPSVNYKVWVTGNSLGAALSNICGLWLDVNGCPVEGVYTFAAPKCANDKFANLYDERLFGRCHRWVNGHKLPNDDRRDIVTEVPPSPTGGNCTIDLSVDRWLQTFLKTTRTELTFPCGYTHVGKEHEVDETDDYLFSDGAPHAKIRAHFTEGYSRGIYKELIKKHPDIAVKVPLPSA